MVDDRVGWSGRLRPTDGVAEGGRGQRVEGDRAGMGREERTGRKEGGKRREAKRERGETGVNGG